MDSSNIEKKKNNAFELSLDESLYEDIKKTMLLSYLRMIHCIKKLNKRMLLNYLRMVHCFKKKKKKTKKIFINYYFVET